MVACYLLRLTDVNGNLFEERRIVAETVEIRERATKILIDEIMKPRNLASARVEILQRIVGIQVG